MPLFSHKSKSEKGPQVITFTADEDLDVVFDRALEQYQAITGVVLPRSERRTFDDVTADIWSTIRKESAVTNSKAITVIQKFSACLSKFGSIIASTASAAFPGTGQCWNAVSLILGAAAEYKAIFDGFITLMERTAAFMDNLNIFLSKKASGGQILDPLLRRKTYEILALMLNLLAKSHKLTHSKREQFKAAVGVFLFSSDEGVKGSLLAFETAMGDLTGMEVTAILANVENLAIDMLAYHEEVIDITKATLRNTEDIKTSTQRIEAANEHLVGAVGHIEALAERNDQRAADIKATTERFEANQNKQISEKKATETLERIAEALHIKQSGEKQAQPWSDRHHNICRSRVPDTGKWLLSMPEYLAWSHTSEHDTKLMTLSGDAGSGKSYISSHVVDDILQRYTKGHLSQRPERVPLAYYYFDRTATGAKGLSKEAVKESTAAMLARIIFQWAQSSSEYAKAVAAVCARSNALSKALPMWTALVTDLVTTIPGTYFVVIDGYERDEDEDDTTAYEAMQSLVNSCASSDSRIRLFLSGGEDDIIQLTPLRVFSNVQIRLGKPRPSFGLVRRASSMFPPDEEGNPTPNQEDLIAFANARIGEICAKEPDLARILKDPEVHAGSTLAKGVRGDYNSLVAKLDQIVTSDGDDEDIKDIVARASESKAQSLGRVIDELHAKLKPSEVEELNAILPWAFGVLRPCELGLLQNALLMTHGKARGLQSHIKTRYRPLLRLNKEREIELWDPELMEMLEELNADRERARDSDVAMIQRGEINVLSRVIKTFAGEELYERLDFDDFFKAKMDHRPAHVATHSAQDNHILISRTCLQVLCEKSTDEQFEVLRRYATIWFHEHLQRIELDQADEETIRLINYHLTTLFWEPALIDVWWHPDLIFWLWQDFVNDQEGTYLELISAWLKAGSSTLPSSYDAEKKRWLDEIVAGDKYKLMSRIATRLCKRWFSNIRADVISIKAACGIFLKMTAPTAAETMVEDEISVEQIETFTSWAEASKDFTVENSLWTWRAAAIYKVYSHTEKSLELCMEARKEGLDHWTLLFAMAELHVELGEHKVALQYLEELRKRESEIGVDTDEAELIWEEIVPLQASCHLALDDAVSAVACYRSVLEHELEAGHQHIHASAVSELFKLWNSRQQYSEILSVVEALSDTTKKPNGYGYWSPLVYQEDFHARIGAAVRHTNRLQPVTAAYTRAIGEFSLDDSVAVRNTSFALRYYHAAIMFGFSTLQDDHDEALDQLVKLIKELGHDPSVYGLTYRFIRGLARYFLDEAVQHGINERPVPELAAGYAKRFDDLVGASLPAVQNMYDGYHDPRLTVARLKVLAGDAADAKKLLTDKLRNALDDWPESDDEDVSERIEMIVSCLMVFDNDEDAITAWRLLEPSRTLEGQEAPDTVDGAAEHDTAEPHDGSTKPDEVKPQLGDEKALYGNGGLDTIGGALHSDDPPESHDQSRSPNQPKPLDQTETVQETALPSDQASPSCIATEEPTVAQDQTLNTSTQLDEDSLAGLNCSFGFSCDGDCNTIWRVVGDLYACKDCLCVQFCKDCYEKMRSGSLRNLNCGPKHTHIYVPPFNRAEWEQRPGMIVAGSGLMTRNDWLNKLRAEWGLQQEAIDAHKELEQQKREAARFIAKAITKAKRKKMALIVEQVQAQKAVGTARSDS